MVELRPNRVLGSPHDQFWEYCAQGELRVPRCDVCAHLTWPASETCEACGARSLSWARMSGRATLVSWCTFERKYYERLPVPWDTILVALEEGPLMISNPQGFSASTMRIGMNVELAFVECQDDAGQFLLPVFAESKQPR